MKEDRYSGAVPKGQVEVCKNARTNSGLRVVPGQ